MEHKLREGNKLIAANYFKNKEIFGGTKKSHYLCKTKANNHDTEYKNNRNLERNLPDNVQECSKENEKNKDSNQQYQITSKINGSNMGLIKRVAGGETPRPISTKEMFPNLGNHCIAHGQEWEIIGVLGVQFIIQATGDGSYAKNGSVCYYDDILYLPNEIQ